MNNIARIQEKLVQTKLDAILIMDEKNQRYATGFPIKDGAVLVAEKHAWLITDPRYTEAASAAVDSCIEVQEFNIKNPMKEILRADFKEAGVRRLGAEEYKLSCGRYMNLQKLLGIKFVPAQIIMDVLRASKTEEEIKYLIKAQRISEKALEETLPIIKPGVTERQVAAHLVYRMLVNGSEGNSFDPIVVAGKNTSRPHGMPGDNPIKEGDFVTMDFGSLYMGYCSDMTRTVAVGNASDEMKNVYSTVLEAQLAGIKAARAGVTGAEIDAAARGLIERDGFGEYFGHGFGHSLGLDIHENPCASPGVDTPMPLNAVISAEPGIYIPGKFGVRIEDVMVLRDKSSEVITKSPKELIIL